MKSFLSIMILFYFVPFCYAGHLDECSPLVVAGLMKSQALYPYTLLDEQENTYLHWLVKNGDIEKLLAVIDHYPFSIQNKNGEYPIDIINRQLEITFDDKRRERLALCATILHRAGESFSNSEAAVAVIGRTPNCILLEDQAAIFVRLLKKSIRLNNTNVFNALIARYRSSLSLYQNSIPENNMDELRELIRQHKSNSQEFYLHFPRSNNDCVIV